MNQRQSEKRNRNTNRQENGKRNKKRNKYVKILNNARKFLRVFVRTTLLCLAILLLVGGCIGVKMIKNIIAKAPDITKESVIPGGYKSVVLDNQGNKTADLIAEGSNRIWVDMEQIPQHVRNAFVAVEDERFYEHNGIDGKGILRAACKGTINGFHFTEGASTITQQLLKNSVFDFMSEEGIADKIERKIQEQYLAVKLEKDLMSKEEILEAYLNTINLGQNTLGIQAAANRYFGKDVSALTVSEAAVIAGITKNPVSYNPISNPEANRKRQEIVLSDMLEQELISQREYEEALDDDVYSRIKSVDENTQKQVVYSYFVESVIKEVLEDLQKEKGYTYEQAYKLVYCGGLTIESTQDSFIQGVMDEEMQNSENIPVAAQDTALDTEPLQASMVVMEQYTGHVKGVVGGLSRKEKNMTLNRAVDTVRQPGSTFKVVSTYAPALDTMGMSLATTQFDAPYAYANGRAVRNWNGEAYYGWAALRRGIEQSMNVVAVRTITDITPDVAYQYALNFGFTSLVGELDENGHSDIVQPMALGGLTKGVSNLELTAAYAAIANKGIYTEPVFYTRVFDHDGNVLLEKQFRKQTVLKETTAWLLTDAMKDVVSRGTGTAARFEGMSIAGKTGTTSQYNDVWFVGYTPYYTAGIWAGYDNNQKLGRDERKFHEIIWKKVMTRIHEGLPDKDFEKPEGIVSSEICSQSGKLPIPGICDGCVRTEFFAAGTVPMESCDVHVVEIVCTESGQIATDQCASTEARIITLAPIDLQEPSSSMVRRELMIPVCTLHPGEFRKVFFPEETDAYDNGEGISPH